MTTTSRLYATMPRALQHLAVSTRGAQIRRARFGSTFREHLAEYEDRNRSVRQTEIDRHVLLDEALDRARAAAAYREHGVGPLEIERFPVVTKAQQAADPGAYHLPYEGRRLTAATGGSTGTPLRFETTSEAVRRQWAIWWRYRRWHGIDLDTWCGHFGGRSTVAASERSVFWRYNVPGRQVMFSARHLDASTVGAYVAEIDRRRLRWLHGLPSTILLLTSLMAEAGLRFDAPVRWITFGSENVVDGTYELIQEVHGVRARQHYGLAEGVANLSECPDGRLHVDEDFSYVEVLPYLDGQLDGSAPTLHRLVGTSFTNRAQAFVRYDTGDLVSGIEAGCDCGRPGRTVAAIEGRTASYAVLASGSRVGPISHVFRGLEGIVQGQVFVSDPATLVFHVVPGRGYQEAVAAEIRTRVREQALEPVDVEVEVRRSLWRAPNGKVPVVVQGDPPRPEDRSSPSGGAR